MHIDDIKSFTQLNKIKISNKHQRGRPCGAVHKLLDNVVSGSNTTHAIMFHFGLIPS